MEAAYQASKCLFPVDRIQFCALDPASAKRVGKTVHMIQDWDNRKYYIMSRLVHLKFQDVELRQLLLNTGDRYIMEGNRWHDTVWGIDLNTGKGLNRLGIILMDERDAIRKHLEEGYQ